MPSWGWGMGRCWSWGTEFQFGEEEKVLERMGRRPHSCVNVLSAAELDTAAVVTVLLTFRVFLQFLKKHGF